MKETLALLLAQSERGLITFQELVEKIIDATPEPLTMEFVNLLSEEAVDSIRRVVIASPHSSSCGITAWRRYFGIAA